MNQRSLWINAKGSKEQCPFSDNELAEIGEIAQQVIRSKQEQVLQVRSFTITCSFRTLFNRTQACRIRAIHGKSGYYMWTPLHTGTGVFKFFEGDAETN